MIAIAIFFSILISSAYFSHYTEAAAEFLSPSPKLEIFDQEFLSAAREIQLKAFPHGDFLDGLRCFHYFSGFFYHFSSIIPSLDPGTFVLRC